MKSKDKNMMNIIGYFYSDNALKRINWISIKY